MVPFCDLFALSVGHPDIFLANNICDKASFNDRSLIAVMDYRLIAQLVQLFKFNYTRANYKPKDTTSQQEYHITNRFFPGKLFLLLLIQTID